MLFKKSRFAKVFIYVLVFAFSCNMIVPPNVAAQMATVLDLPIPGTMIHLSAGYQPAIIRGVTIHPDNPFEFDFIVDTGDTGLEGDDLKFESNKLIKYFLASLTVPEDEVWVNLSPYEDDRIVTKNFGQTEMGIDLLAQDYILKQLSASMMYPEDELGAKFWERVYAKAQEQYGSIDIPMNTFNKIWIVPEKAYVYEHDSTAYVVFNKLKVMLEEDYVALQKNRDSEKYGMKNLMQKDVEVVSGVTSQIVKEILIPEMEKEVNEGKTFANLRQIANAMVLATWYKKNLKESLLSQVYADKNKTLGVDVEDKELKNKIFDQYVASFKKGVFDYIKEDFDPLSQQIIPRKYFSGGSALKYPDGAMTTFKVVDNVPPMDRGMVAKGLKKIASAQTTVKVTAAAVNVDKNLKEQIGKDGFAQIKEGSGTFRLAYGDLFPGETGPNIGIVYDTTSSMVNNKYAVITHAYGSTINDTSGIVSIGDLEEVIKLGSQLGNKLTWSPENRDEFLERFASFADSLIGNAELGRQMNRINNVIKGADLIEVAKNLKEKSLYGEVYKKLKERSINVINIRNSNIIDLLDKEKEDFFTYAREGDVKKIDAEPVPLYWQTTETEQWGPETREVERYKVLMEPKDKSPEYFIIMLASLLDDPAIQNSDVFSFIKEIAEISGVDITNTESEDTVQSEIEKFLWVKKPSMPKAISVLPEHINKIMNDSLYTDAQNKGTYHKRMHSVLATQLLNTYLREDNDLNDEQKQLLLQFAAMHDFHPNREVAEDGTQVRPDPLMTVEYFLREFGNPELLEIYYWNILDKKSSVGEVGTFLRDNTILVEDRKNVLATVLLTLRSSDNFNTPFNPEKRKEVRDLYDAFFDEFAKLASKEEIKMVVKYGEIFADKIDKKILYMASSTFSDFLDVLLGLFLEVKNEKGNPLTLSALLKGTSAFIEGIDDISNFSFVMGEVASKYLEEKDLQEIQQGISREPNQIRNSQIMTNYKAVRAAAVKIHELTSAGIYSIDYIFKQAEVAFNKEQEKIVPRLRIVPRQLDRTGTDAAMTNEQLKDSSMTNKQLKGVGKKGGIDLDPAMLDLQIKRDGNGVPLPLWDQPLKDMDIEGFVPVIINVTPININFPILSELEKSEGEENAGSA